MRFASSGRCVWPRAASRIATREPYPFCSISSIGSGLVATRATSTTRSCSATWPSGRWTGHCESARKWRRKGLKTFDPRPEMRPAGPVDPQVRCLPSSIRGGVQVARKRRRKSLERLDSRPEMAPRLACRMTGPRPSNTVTPAHAGSRRRSRLTFNTRHLWLARLRGHDNDRTAWALLFLIWTARNPLKSPESDERIQENPSPFSWSGLVWIWFGLEQFGLRRSQTAWPVAPASPFANGAPGAGVAKATAPGGLQNRPELSKPAATDASRSVAATCCEDSAAGDWGESACAIFGARELSHRPWGRYTSEG